MYLPATRTTIAVAVMTSIAGKNVVRTLFALVGLQLFQSVIGVTLTEIEDAGWYCGRPSQLCSTKQGNGHGRLGGMEDYDR